MHERLAEQTASFSSIARKSLASPSILDFEPAAEKLLKASGFNSIARKSLTSPSISGFETVAEKLATPSLLIPNAREILAPKPSFYPRLPEQIEGLKGIKEEISLASHIAKQLMPHQERVDEFRAAVMERLDVRPILEKLGIFWQAEDEEIDSFLKSVSWTGPTVASNTYFDQHFEFIKQSLKNIEQSNKNIAADIQRASNRATQDRWESRILTILTLIIAISDFKLWYRADHHYEAPSVPQTVEPAKVALVKPDHKNAATPKEIYSPWVKSTQSPLPAPKKAALR